MRENVTSNINYIDEVMKKRVEAFKDIHNEEDNLKSASQPSGKLLANQSAGSIAPMANHLLDRPDNRRKELMEKYSHLLKKGTVKSEVQMDPFGNSNEHDDNYEVIFEEMERLKQSETEARHEVLQL